MKRSPTPWRKGLLLAATSAALVWIILPYYGAVLWAVVIGLLVLGVTAVAWIPKTRLSAFFPENAPSPPGLLDHCNLVLTVSVHQPACQSKL